MNHPIELPPELFAEWLAEGRKRHIEPALIAGFVAEKAAECAGFVAEKAVEWAADEELTACCAAIKLAWEMEPVMTVDDLLRELRQIRRPKPLSLKEQALAVLQQLTESGYPANYQPDSAWDTIRRALDALPD